MRAWHPLTHIERVERVLEQRPPAAGCCCNLWPLEHGVRWAIFLLMLEAGSQLLLSLLRPWSLWFLSRFVFFCFVTQDLTRLAMFASAAYTAHAMRQNRGVLRALQMLFRTLVVLVVLELLEMILKLFEEHAICDVDMHQLGPRAVRFCEVINDVSEVVLSIGTIIALCYAAWLIHSFARYLRAGVQVAPIRNWRTSSTVSRAASPPTHTLERLAEAEAEAEAGAGVESTGGECRVEGGSLGGSLPSGADVGPVDGAGWGSGSSRAIDVSGNAQGGLRDDRADASTEDRRRADAGPSQRHGSAAHGQHGRGNPAIDAAGRGALTSAAEKTGRRRSWGKRGIDRLSRMAGRAPQARTGRLHEEHEAPQI